MTNKKKATSKKRTGLKRQRTSENALPIVRVYQPDQEEAHGWKEPYSIACGYCAMKAVYIFFGLEKNENTEKADLWDRLGVDKIPIPAFNFPLRDKIYKYVKSLLPKDTEGALPMDMCEVIWEDGFDYETTTNCEEFIAVLPLYIEMGYPALVLRTLGNPLAHWVVVSGITEDKICIADSLDSGYEFEWVSIEYFQKIFNCAIMITDHGVARKPGRNDYIVNYTSGAKMVILAAGKEWIW